MERENDMMDRKQLNEKETGRKRKKQKSQVIPEKGEQK